MSYTTTTTSKGQLTIPKEVRDKIIIPHTEEEQGRRR